MVSAAPRQTLYYPRIRGPRPWIVLSAAIVALLLSLLASGEGRARAATDRAQPPNPADWLSDAAVAESPHLRVSLLVDPPRKPSSEHARVGVLFDLEPGWHLYWRNPGDTGLSPELDWSVNGGRVGEIQWPAPQPFDGSGSGFWSFGYSDQVLLLSDLSGYRSVDSLAVEIKVLICADECIPVELGLVRARPAEPGKEQESGLARERALFDRYAERIPVAPSEVSVALKAEYSRAALRPGDKFEGAIVIESCRSAKPDCRPLGASGPVTFIPELATDEALDFEFLVPAPHPELANVMLLPFRGTLESDLERPLTRLAGLLDVRDASGKRRVLKLDLPFPGAPLAAEPIDLGATSLVKVILLALLGGLILNGMPCVLPVLGIKICSAAELAQHDPQQLRRHGFAYLAGVLASMAALACAVVFLKAAGTRVGWGFQFQEPLFVAGVATIVVLFALNLFGVFEIQLGASRLSQLGSNTQGPLRSFFDGLLAVVLATPCTAPFLGTAVGFAFAGSASLIFAIFLAIGFGLAAPYTLICLAPGWSHFVPRAGDWMLRLRAGLGFLLLATAVWLIWIFGRSAGADGQATLLALLVALSFGAWLLGWIQQHASPGQTLAAVCTLFVLVGTGLSHIDVDASGNATATASSRDWSRFDPAAIEGALAAGQPVFVSFSADWCITCKVNERGVLADPRVRGALEQRGFSVFHGDWTRRDELIRAELARFGRAGVPLYLVYDPRDPENPTVLPELLSVEVVLAALDRISPPNRVAAQSAAWRKGPTRSEF